MSELTLSLLNRKAPKGAKHWHRRVTGLTEALVAEYGTPSLGNYRDPVKEIFYIVLSARTTEALYRPAFRRLWQRFRTLQAIADASIKDIRKCVVGAGLGGKRSAQVRKIARKLLRDFGANASKELRKFDAKEAYRYLRGLPGVGPKSALCVMMYSLDFDVFPVDAHAQRVLARVGLIRRGAKHYQAQDRLPAFIPAARAKQLHVALLVHGRLICRPSTPACGSCSIARYCRSATN